MKLENLVFDFDMFASEMANLKEKKHFDYLVTIVGEDFGGEEGLGCIYILENTDKLSAVVFGSAPLSCGCAALHTAQNLGNDISNFFFRNLCSHVYKLLLSYFECQIKYDSNEKRILVNQFDLMFSKEFDPFI